MDNNMTLNLSTQVPRGFIPGRVTTMSNETVINLPGDSRYFGIIVGLLVFIFGTAGNGITVWAYIRNKNLQTSFNVLIANLCLIDLLFSCIIIPFTVVTYFTGYNVYGNAFCSVVGYFYYASLASSLYNLTAIAVNRYSGIVKPNEYQRLFTGKRLAICIATIWLIPPILYIPIVAGRSIKFREDTLRCAVGSDNDVSPAIAWYNMVLNITFQAVPLIILIALYSAIFAKVKQVQKKMKEHQSSFRKSHKKLEKQGSNISNASSIKNRSGNTSDDTGDEFRPSSLIEGVTFRPVQTEHKKDVSSEIPSPAPTPTPAEDTRPTGDAVFMNHDDSASEQSESAPPSPDIAKASEKTRKRNSIWQLLIRNSQKLHSQNLEMENLSPRSPSLSVSTDQQWSEDETPSTPATPVMSPEPIEEVKRRVNNLEIKETRRKKSLSAPTLPIFDFSNSVLIKEATEAAKTHNHHLRVPGLDTTDSRTSDDSLQKSPNQTKTSYTKRKTETRARALSHENSPFKDKVSLSIRIKRQTKEWASNLSMHGDSEDDGQHPKRKRLGTIARKVQERNQRREDRERRKRKRHERMLRKKHARERQLAYSSFVICVAFAVCILPTSILYLVQITTGITIAANVVLIVGCIAWLHAILNPLIYGYLNSQYRREYSRIFKCMKNKITRSSKAGSNIDCKPNNVK
ncbi:unnamed protein product [Clavelina lepadiformis]|uniref:G-protein coupled receptors family 1 profile domain-containing protein n=1 Tax=Clavelina lepadiformis TaxID=159417 RepID=A0ABP0GBJ1_CLALP